MKKFHVFIPELHYVKIEVKAETEKEAVEKAQIEYGNKDALELEYSHTDNDTQNWKIEEIV